MTQAKKRSGPPLPHEPAEYLIADLVAVQALAGGTADADQQKRALHWIVEGACDAYGLGWHPDSAHAASFVAGRRFAGLQVVKAIKVNVGLLKKGGENG